MDLKKNADGSVDIYCGPKAPKGFETNWIPTVPGRNWFSYFRLYGSPRSPTPTGADRSAIARNQGEGMKTKRRYRLPVEI